MKEDLACLEVADFVQLFGTTAERFPHLCRELVTKYDFRYRRLANHARDQVLLDVFQRIDSGQLSVAGKHRQEQWEAGWGENLEAFRAQNHDPTALVPKYIRAKQPVRLHQDYVLPVDPMFELHWFEIFQQWLFSEYFSEAKNIYEFGCGSGINLAALAKLFPQKTYVGCDWAQSSVDIVAEMGKSYGWKMSGRRFDFFDPDETLEIGPESIVFTVGALEQTGCNFQSFVHFLLRRAPLICIHIEPIVEWYDPKNIVDYAAIRFHRQRKYLDGFSTHLEMLQQEGHLEIIKSKRSYFGSLFMEGYSQTIWRPLKQL